MFDRISTSIGLTTILSVLAKLALEYQAEGRIWFDGPVTQHDLYLLLAALFCIFFRGKMMHDDSAYFSDLDEGKFREDEKSRKLIKAGLMLAYLSWLCWAPAIFFLESPVTFGKWMAVSLGLSTLWLVVDIMTRKEGESGTPEARKRWWWLLINVAYLAGMACLFNSSDSPAWVISLMLVFLVLDWVFLDSLIRGRST